MGIAKRWVVGVWLVAGLALSGCEGSWLPPPSSSAATSTTGGAAAAGTTGSQATSAGSTGGSASEGVTIGVTPALTTLARGTSVHLYATATFPDGGTSDVTGAVDWSSDNDAVASVDATGLAQANAAGVVSVRASLDGAQGTATLAVSNAVLQRLELSAADLSLARGTQEQLTATGFFSDGSSQDLTASVGWLSSDASVASVDDARTKGLLQAQNAGGFVVTATDEATGKSGTLGMTVTSASLVSIAVTSASASLAKGTSARFVATGTFSDGSSQDLSSTVTWSSSDDAIASLSNAATTKGEATANAAGSVTVSATDSKTGITGAAQLEVTDAVLIALTVDPGAATIAKGTSQPFTATGLFSDGSNQDLTGSVVWTSSGEAVSISNAAGSQGLASGLGAGSVSIVATDAQSGIAGSASLSVTTASLASLSVNSAAGSIPLGSGASLSAIGTFSDGTSQDLTSSVTWTSSDESVAQVSNVAGSQGRALATGVGSALITATDAVSGLQGTVELDVAPAVLTSISVTPSSTAVAKGLSQQLAATGLYSDGSSRDLTGSVTWTSSDEGVAKVSGGLVKGVAVGAASLSATDAQTGITGSASLSVVAATLAAIELSQDSSALARGTSQQLSATGLFSDGTSADITSSVTWTSSDDSVATISNAAGSQGRVSGANVGSATFTATDAVSGLSASASMEVTSAVLVSIEVGPSSVAVPKGISQAFTATGTFSDGSTQSLTASASWSSSDEGVATISANVAAGVAAGSATITATDAASGIHGSATLTVTAAALTGISVTPSSPSIALGTSQQLTATATFSDGTSQDVTSSFTWSSSNEAIASVSNSAGSQGKARAAGAGSTTITATDPVTGHSGSASLTVTAATLASISIAPGTGSIAQGTSQRFSATGTYSDGTTQDITGSVLWSSSDEGVATISNAAGSQGLAHGVKSGTATITAAAMDLHGTASLVVSAAQLTAIAVTPGDTSAAKGTAAQFVATATYSDGSTRDVTSAVTWSSSDVGVATVSNSAGSKGKASAVATGSATISALDPASGVSGGATLGVTGAALSAIALSPLNATLVKNLSQGYTALGTFTDGSTQDVTATVSWTTSDSGVATISSSGKATGTGAGSVTLTATSGEVSASTTLTVTNPVLVSIAISPPTVPNGTSVQMVATGTYSDGSSADVTPSATWYSSDPGTISVSNASGSVGLATAHVQGSVSMVAVVGSVDGSATITTCPDAAGWYVSGGHCAYDYLIPAAQLTNQWDECGTGNYYNQCNGSPIGFTWSDTGTGLTGITSITVTVNEGINCDTANSTENFLMNGTAAGTFAEYSQDSYATTGYTCTCGPTTTLTTFTVDAAAFASYAHEGPNSIELDYGPGAECYGLSPDASLSGNYAKVTVVY